MFSPAAGSSSSSSVGSMASARANSTRRCRPKERFPAGVPASSARSSFSRMACAASRIARSSFQVRGRSSIPARNPARERMWRPTWTFSATVMRGNSRVVWNVRAMPSAAMACGFHPVIGRPRNLTTPDAGFSAPAMMLSVVVFPAPFGPISARMSPSATRSPGPGRRAAPEEPVKSLRVKQPAIHRVSSESGGKGAAGGPARPARRA